MRRPYYRRDRKKWFVKTDDGSSQIYLGETKREAYAAWESMRRQGEPGRWRIADLAAAVVADAAPNFPGNLMVPLVPAPVHVGLGL